MVATEVVREEEDLAQPRATPIQARFATLDNLLVGAHSVVRFGRR
jgi:hypothetical protein